MAWKSILTDGSGLYGTVEFFSKIMVKRGITSNPEHWWQYMNEPFPFQKENAEIIDIEKGFDGNPEYFEITMKLEKSGNGAFILHKLLVKTMMEFYPVNKLKDLKGKNVTVYLKGRVMGFQQLR